ncbi:MAG: esterase-like activity of phytase family protein, partial [Bacteroidales bacterium]|nr:esterase-like activity of phytase family protein [Bacteroidales bacterium]
MKRILTLLALLALSAGLDFEARAQEIPDSVRTASADTLASAPSDSIAPPVMRRPPAVPLDPIQASSIAQVRLLIRSGEYSGLTWAGGSQYAVVHDKGNSGGIYSFVVYTDSTGIPSSVLAYELEAGRNSKESSLDNEDVVYVPSRRSLFVVSEAQQSIREYDLFGKPTGAQLEVPSAFAKANITSGHGFESLAYN